FRGGRHCCFQVDEHSYLSPASLSHFQDIFNSLFSCVFLGGGIYFAFKARRLLPKPYLTAMILMGAAAICSFIDMLLQFQHFRGLRLRKYVYKFTF
uniref:Uncharacterized protein n=1 Tax=Mus spicilegus TaxID=10103 RepID=A0A8C6MPN5_MUSSI